MSPSIGRTLLTLLRVGSPELAHRRTTSEVVALRYLKTFIARRGQLYLMTMNNEDSSRNFYLLQP
jgi:hypothetical protein